MTILSFDQGTLLLDGLDQPVGQTVHMTPPGFILDARVGAWRSEAYRYRDAVLWLRGRKIPFADRARHYDPLKLHLQPRTEIQLYDYQEQAVAAWRRMDQRGIVERSAAAEAESPAPSLGSAQGALPGRARPNYEMQSMAFRYKISSYDFH